MPSWFQHDKIVSILTVGRQGPPILVHCKCMYEHDLLYFFNVQKYVPHH